jgi:uncharacterized protein YegL
VLLLDTSYSMSEGSAADGGRTPIDELNDGFALFCKEIGEDEYAGKRAEIAVITFGGTARVAIDFTEGRELQPQRFAAGGGTPMGSAIDIAINEITMQKQAYKEAGLLYYRPWLFALSDGAPTDPDLFEASARRLRELEARNGVNVFAVGVGQNASLEQLAMLTDSRKPMALKGLAFGELFQWLSSSMGTVSQSAPPAINGADDTEQFALPPAGWGTVPL